MADDVSSAIQQAAERYGLDPAMLTQFGRIESGLDPSARTGSYRGLFQLGPDEWRQYGSGDINDPYANANAAASKISSESAAFKQQYGRDPTPTDLYMIHQQGAGGYGAHLNAPNAPAWQNMASTAEGQRKGEGWAKQAIWGNIPDSLKPQFGSVDNVTSQNLIDIYHGKLTGQPGQPIRPPAQPAGAAAPSSSTLGGWLGNAVASLGGQPGPAPAMMAGQPPQAPQSPAGASAGQGLLGGTPASQAVPEAAQAPAMRPLALTDAWASASNPGGWQSMLQQAGQPPDLSRLQALLQAYRPGIRRG